MARLVQLRADLSGAGYGNSVPARTARCRTCVARPWGIESREQSHHFQARYPAFVAEIIEIEPDERIHLLLDIMGQTTHITAAPSTIIPAR